MNSKLVIPSVHNNDRIPDTITIILYEQDIVCSLLIFHQ